MSRRLIVTTGIAGVLVAIAGVGVLASRAAREAGFGWFAYAPLSDQQLDGLVAVNGARVAGAVLMGAGLALVALAVGARAGRSVTRSGLHRGVAVVGGLLVVAGLVTVLVPRTGSAVGEELAVTASPVLLLVQVAGLGIALLGVLLLVGLVGTALGSSPAANARRE